MQVQGLSKNITFIGHMASLSTFFSWAYAIVVLFSYFITFSNLFLNLLSPLSRTYLGLPRYVRPRISRGCIQHSPFKMLQQIAIYNFCIQDFVSTFDSGTLQLKCSFLYFSTHNHQTWNRSYRDFFTIILLYTQFKHSDWLFNFFNQSQCLK